MQRRLFILIGVLLAVLTILGLAAVFVFQQMGGDGTPAEPIAEVTPAEPDAVPTREVIVAVQPIGRGEAIRNEALGRLELPETSIPPNIINNELEAVGKVARADIVQGQVIVAELLRDQFSEFDQGSEITGDREEAAFAIPPGHVMVAFPVNRQSSVAYAISPGDVVDVLVSVSFVDFDPEFQTILPNKFSFIEPRRELEDGTVVPVSLSQTIDRGRLVIENESFPGIEFPSEDQRPRRVAQLTVQRAKVIRVGSWIDEPTPAEAQPAEEGAPTPTPPLPDIVSLAVTPQDALVLLWARQTQAYMELALRAATDSEADHSTEAVTLQYMLTRFNLTVPPKLEFGIDRSDTLDLFDLFVPPVDTTTETE